MSGLVKLETKLGGSKADSINDLTAFEELKINDIPVSPSGAHHTSHALGKLSVHIVEARGLHVNDPKFSRPYCVVAFENNEIVTKEGTTATPTSLQRVESKLGGFFQSNKNQGVGTMACPIWEQKTIFDVTRADGELMLTVWDRTPPKSSSPTSDNKTASTGSLNGDHPGETFLGLLKLRPSQIDGKLLDNWFRLIPRQYKEKIKGEIRIQLQYQKIKGLPKPLGPTDFDFLRVLGKGSFGKVIQVRKKDTGRIYAMKVLVKKDIVARNEIQHTLAERNVLARADHPFLVGLKFSFQTPDKLYLVLDFMNGGELFYHLQKATAFSEARATFYTAELVLALQHLHKYDIVYRDLKPENCLLDASGHVALTDFGLTKENVTETNLTSTFCGTAEYLAPETLKGDKYGKAVDWWSLGILFFEMTTGLPPFYSSNSNTMYRKILHSPLVLPKQFSPAAKDFVTRCLDRNPKTRLGSGPNEAEEVKQHPIFADIAWDKLLKKQVKVPFKPHVNSEGDASNFDPTFTRDTPIEDPKSPNIKSPLSPSTQNQFRGFTYNEEESALRHALAEPTSPNLDTNPSREKWI